MRAGNQRFVWLHKQIDQLLAALCFVKDRVSDPRVALLGEDISNALVMLLVNAERPELLGSTFLGVQGPGRVELDVPSLRTRLLNGIYTQEDATRAPHFRVLEEAAAYTVAYIRRNSLQRPACPFSTSLDAKNIGSPSARTSESIVDVVTSWLVLLRPPPPPCRRRPPYILSLRICVARETLRRISTPNAHILRFLNTTSRTAKPCQRRQATRDTLCHTDGSTSRGCSVHSQCVINTEWDGNGAAATDGDACVAANADANACAPPSHHCPANKCPATPSMPSSSSCMPYRQQQPVGDDDFGFSSPLGDDESDQTTSASGTRAVVSRVCGVCGEPSVVPAGGALASAASQGGMDALEELRLLKDQVRDISCVCNAVATGDLSQKITVRV
ncbi:hypothetical protein B0H11DRAFT_2251468 [Mycena galericulata]|nr:hypothetical protein B0H11DRAFT_2251468 [Mycena galericulata]